MDILKFGLGGNAKLDKKIATFSILSGHSCPGADKCYTKVIIDSNNKRKVIDGKNQEFRCFSASQEALYTNVYNNREHNYNLILNIIKDKSLNSNAKSEAIYKLFVKSLPSLHKWSILRLHVGGDIFCQEYFDALIMLANNFKTHIFYAYTKSIHFWVKRLDKIPDNFKLTASHGGKYDDLIDKYNLKSVKVIMSEEEAEMYNLEIDHDDSHAYDGNDNFALLLHGSQPKGSVAAKAKIELAKNGWTGYTNANNKLKKEKNMLNLIQYQDLKLYLISLLLEISNVKNIKSDFDRNIPIYIEYMQGDVIYSDIKILDKITFDYNNLVYTCFKVNQLSNNDLTKWICDCDNKVEIVKIYNEIANNNVKITTDNNVSDNDYILNSLDIDIIKQYYMVVNNIGMFHTEFNITLYKIYDLGTKIVYYDSFLGLINIPNQYDIVNEFINACKEMGVMPKPILNKLSNTILGTCDKIVITNNSMNYNTYVTSKPLFKINDKISYDNNITYVKDIDWQNTTKVWMYYTSDDFWFTEQDIKKVEVPNPIDPIDNSSYREDKSNKIRPDLISPYFLESIGRLMKDNNEKYPEFNYIGLSDSSFFQSMWRHIIAYSEQRLQGVSTEFDNKEDHLTAIAFNAMGLIHNREVSKL